MRRREQKKKAEDTEERGGKLEKRDEIRRKNKNSDNLFRNKNSGNY